MGAYDLVEIEAELIRESPYAYLIDDGRVREWVPKSLCEHERIIGDTIIVDLPNWICYEKGLI